MLYQIVQYQITKSGTYKKVLKSTISARIAAHLAEVWNLSADQFGVPLVYRTECCHA